MKTLVEQGFSQAEVLAVLNGKGSNQIVPILNVCNFISAYMGTVVETSGAIYGIIVAFAFMFPNAELALLLFSSYQSEVFVPGLVAVDLYLGVSGQSLFGGPGMPFAHVGGALFGFLISWYWKKNQFENNRWN
jgi:membrane associated rhomboid family serine protease